MSSPCGLIKRHEGSKKRPKNRNEQFPRMGGVYRILAVLSQFLYSISAKQTRQWSFFSLGPCKVLSSSIKGTFGTALVRASPSVLHGPRICHISLAPILYTCLMLTFSIGSLQVAFPDAENAPLVTAPDGWLLIRASPILCGLLALPPAYSFRHGKRRESPPRRQGCLRHRVPPKPS